MTINPVLHPIKWFRERKRRVVPDEYLKDGGFRRLGETQEQVQAKAGMCWTCRNAVAYVSWHCARKPEPCKWEPAYSKDIIKHADIEAGRKIVGSQWLPLPDAVGEKDVQQ